MKVRMLKQTRIEKARKGETVEVSLNRALFLLRYGLAEPVTAREQAETPETKTERKTTRKRTTK